ncbi:hypothetical protein Tco_0890053 [Tanacetum coccineum]
MMSIGSLTSSLRGQKPPKPCYCSSRPPNSPDNNNNNNNNKDKSSTDWDKAWSSFKKQGKKSLFSQFKPNKYVSWNPRRSNFPLSEEVGPCHAGSMAKPTFTPRYYIELASSYKWHTLNANCQKFNAAYKRAKRLGKSGENDVDYLKRAQSIYRDEHKGVAFSQEDAWAVLRFHPKWDAPEQVDLTGDVPGASQEDLFGHDARPRPAGKPRPAKKSKSDATASTGGSSASTQFGELMEQELRLKREAAERAFEAQAEKDRTLMRLEELRFLATSTKDLDDDDAYWIKKQKKLIKNKMKNDLGDEDDEDEDE